MGKVVLGTTMSLDGYINDPGGGTHLRFRFIR